MAYKTTVPMGSKKKPKLKKANVKRGKKTKKNIVDKLITMFNLWDNHDQANPVDGSRPFSKHQLIIYEPSMHFVFKWFVSKEDLAYVAKHIGEKLEKDQNILKLEMGEYQIELEQYPE